MSGTTIDAYKDLPSPEILKAVLVTGDLEPLTPDQRNDYVLRVCKTLSLNPLTQPFAFIRLNSKLQLYATKNCTDQLRQIYHISVRIVGRQHIGEVYSVTAQAKVPNGREDTDEGVVAIGKLSGEFLANSMMKAVTKAKRRVTLSICGLGGLLDESEVDSVPNAVPVPSPSDKIDAAQKDTIADLVAVTNTNWDKFQAIMFTSATTIEDIPALDYDRVFRALTKKREAMKHAGNSQ